MITNLKIPEVIIVEESQTESKNGSNLFEVGKPDSDMRGSPKFLESETSQENNLQGISTDKLSFKVNSLDDLSASLKKDPVSSGKKKPEKEGIPKKSIELNNSLENFKKMEGIVYEESEKIGQIESKDLDSHPEIPVEKEISDTGKRIINGFEIEGLEEEEEEMKDFEKHFLGNDNDLGNYWEEKEEDSGKESDNEKLSMRSEMSIDKPIDEDFAKAKEMTVTENLSHLKLEDVMKLETMRGLNLPKDDLFGLQFEESGEENQAAQFLKEQGFKKN